MRIDNYDRDIDYDSDSICDLYFLIYLAYGRLINSNSESDDNCSTSEPYISRHDDSYVLNIAGRELFWDGQYRRIRVSKGEYCKLPSAFTMCGEGGGGWKLKFTYFGATHEGRKNISYATRISHLYGLPVSKHALDALELVHDAMRTG